MTAWEATAPASRSPAQSPGSWARTIQAQLDLVGWVEEDSIVEQAGGGLAFTVHRPGADYEIVWQPPDRVRVSEARTGIRRVLGGLHGMRRLERAALAPLWWLYTEVSVWTLVFTSLSGVYLWARVPRLGLGLGVLALGVVCLGAAAAGVW